MEDAVKSKGFSIKRFSTKYTSHLVGLAVILFLVGLLGQTQPFMFKNKSDCFFINRSSLQLGGNGGDAGQVTLISEHIIMDGQITANGGQGGSVNNTGKINITWNQTCNEPDPWSGLSAISGILMFLGTLVFQWLPEKK